jgi:hypothetical protein
MLVASRRMTPDVNYRLRFTLPPIVQMRSVSVNVLQPGTSSQVLSTTHNAGVATTDPKLSLQRETATSLVLEMSIRFVAETVSMAPGLTSLPLET